MATIQIYVDDDVKTKTDLLFSNLGLDTSTAVQMFFKASLENHGLPFDSKHEKIKTTKSTIPRDAMFGCMRGQYTMSEDFDAPLDDFKEYI